MIVVSTPPSPTCSECGGNGLVPDDYERQWVQCDCVIAAYRRFVNTLADVGSAFDGDDTRINWLGGMLIELAQLADDNRTIVSIKED